MPALFYCPEIAQNSVLSEEESRHCLQVLRHKEGDTINLIDGKGYFWQAEICRIESKKCVLKPLSKSFDTKNQRNYYLHIAVAPTKNIERMEWLVEKCTEIGIDEISFVLCSRSERKEIKLERLEKIAVQAMKQSQRAFLPKINAMEKLPKFLENVSQQNKWIAHLGGSEKKFFGQMVSENSQYCVLIGPEGDFSPEEVVLACAKGFEAISLGNAVLRTETAALLVCAGLAVFYG